MVCLPGGECCIPPLREHCGCHGTNCDEALSQTQTRWTEVGEMVYQLSTGLDLVVAVVVAVVVWFVGGVQVGCWGWP